MYYPIPLCKHFFTQQQYVYFKRVVSLLSLTIQNDSSSQEFYAKTVTALDRKEASDRDVTHKLQEAKDAAKAQEPIPGSSPQRPIAVEPYPKESDISPPGGAPAGNTNVQGDDERSVAGRKTMKGGVTKDVHSGKESPKESPKMVDEQKSQEGDKKASATESKEDHEIEMELNSILKKGPSKSPDLSIA